MSTKNDGGPAFPVPVIQPFGSGCVAVAGMTLRDWFAAHALNGMLCNIEGSGTCPDYAKWAYQYADAMLKERAK